MKKYIHPSYHNDCQVTCSCGNIFTVGATHPKLKIEVCSKCHPYYSGEQRIVDTAGQVERFRKRYKIKD